MDLPPPAVGPAFFFFSPKRNIVQTKVYYILLCVEVPRIRVNPFPEVYCLPRSFRCLYLIYTTFSAYYKRTVLFFFPDSTLIKLRAYSMSPKRFYNYYYYYSAEEIRKKIGFLYDALGENAINFRPIIVVRSTRGLLCPYLFTFVCVSVYVYRCVRLFVIYLH